MSSELAILFELIAPGKIALLVICFAGLWLLSRLLSQFGIYLREKVPGYRLFILQTVTVANFIFYIFGGTFIVYAILKPPKELLIAAGGSIAVAVGLSLKDLVASILAGLILLFDRPFQVGDRVTFEDTYGEIVKIGLRAVRLVTLDDNVVTIPNSSFISGKVSSGNAGAADMMVVITLHVAIDADLTNACSLAKRVLITSRFIYLNKPFTVVASETVFGHVPMVVIRLKAYVIDVKYEKAFETDVLLRTEEAFSEAGIRRPYGLGMTHSATAE